MSEQPKKGAKLHEYLAVVHDLETTKNKVLAETTKLFSKDSPFKGQLRVYTPLEDGGEDFADEKERMTTTVPDRLAYTAKHVAKAIDCCCSVEATNSLAKADILLNGEALAKDVPVQALLQMEKQLKAVRAMLEKAPSLDQANEWSVDEEHPNVWKAEATKSYRSKKIKKHNVIVPATEFHPAQVAADTYDERVGTWVTRLSSGSISPMKKAQQIERCSELIRAITKARQRANHTEVVKLNVGKALFKHIFGD